ncbi:septum site-determining protein Ssd [Actinophytocola gossypii]|uniref:CpaE-like family protein n=1 Tax=Actinophytocola gossypii TaxID=2812003 RepID=A0ABT2J410_9PSEU|nr:septum site-determining protein Ssd [Actinophytocola gossypii]MCT2582496.1 CpaE-like family protein [Actinophytocola gossypii]
MEQTRPLAYVEDEHLLDDVLKVAAAAGCELECPPDVAAARSRWHTAPVVVLDTRAAEHCAQAGLPRRVAVYLVTAEPGTDPPWRQAVAVGAEQVLELPTAETHLVTALADATEAPASTTGRAMAVIGARGGAGASVFAAALGLTALRTANNALLIDCDPLGGGLDVVLGAEQEEGLRWPDLQLRTGRVPATSLHDALPTRTRGKTRLTLLSGARKGTSPAPEAVAAVLEAGRRAGETVICDLPRSLDPGSRAALAKADVTLMIVPAELRACLSARLLADSLADLGVTPHLVIRGPSPGRLTPAQMTKAIGHPLLTVMRPEPNLPQALEDGNFTPRPKGPLARAARTALTHLSTQPRRATS